MPRGSGNCTSCVATQVSRVPHMRTAFRPAPAAQLPAAASPFAAGPPAAGPRQPDLMAQIATTGAGVGHTLGHAITGGFSEGSNAEPARPDITYQEPQGTQMPQRQQPCFYEIKPFLECARNQDDIKLCEGFSEVLKQCRLAFRLA
uniref:Coiled-coil-helix-coiled-coil-helix domain containing 2 n=1 Tax=Chlorocebus sabaeus TaxID=60711 RepID=A0A0D9RW03_CHLSB